MGVIIGVIAILIMMFPWTFQEGIFFDTRTVLYSISGVFFGGLTTIVAAIIGIVYRVLIGGVGVYSGVATIVVTSALGLYWKKIRLLFPKLKITYEYYILGFMASILTLICLLL
jgi:hypothetical protein